MLLADLLAIMNIGRIEQIGTPEEIYHGQTACFGRFLNFDNETPAIIPGRDLDCSGITRLVIGVRSEEIDVGYREDRDQKF